MVMQSVEIGPSLQVAGATATLTLHRPGKRNALGLQDWQAIPAMIVTAERHATVRVIVVRGHGGHFGSGNDIAELASLLPERAHLFAKAMADAAFAIEAATKPVVMAIEGVCFGGSVALALAGDIRVASGTAVFAITPAKLGLIYLRSDLQRLIAAIGLGASKRLLYTGDAIDATRAHAIGLVDEVFPPDRFDADLQHLLASIAGGSPFTLRRTKNMLRGLGGADPETTASLGLFAEAVQGRDFQEGHAAFIGKRPPRFDQGGSDLG